MRINSEGRVQMPCCSSSASIEDLAEAIQESAVESEESGRLVVRCIECSELVEIDLQDPNE